MTMVHSKRIHARELIILTMASLAFSRASVLHLLDGLRERRVETPFLSFNHCMNLLGNDARLRPVLSCDSHRDKLMFDSLPGPRLEHVRGGAGKPSAKKATTASHASLSAESTSKVRRGRPSKLAKPSTIAENQGVAPPHKTASMKTAKNSNARAKVELSAEGPWGIDEDEAFGFYKLLGVARDASQNEIRKAYRSLAIAAHPDRNSDDPDATAKFQTLQKVYEVLSDPDRRQHYDDCGGRTEEAGIEDVFAGRGFSDLYQYFRGLYKRVTPEDISDFQQSYRGGAAEQEDLRRFYRQHKGDISALLLHIPCSEDHDLLRFRLFLTRQVDAKQLPSFAAFKKHRVSKKEAAAAGPDALAPAPRPSSAADDANMEALAAKIAANAERRAAGAASRLGALEKLLTEGEGRGGGSSALESGRGARREQGGGRGTLAAEKGAASKSKSRGTGGQRTGRGRRAAEAAGGEEGATEVKNGGAESRGAGAGRGKATRVGKAPLGPQRVGVSVPGAAEAAGAAATARKVTVATAALAAAPRLPGRPRGVRSAAVSARAGEEAPSVAVAVPRRGAARGCKRTEEPGQAAAVAAAATEGRGRGRATAKGKQALATAKGASSGNPRATAAPPAGTLAERQPALGGERGRGARKRGEAAEVQCGGTEAGKKGQGSEESVAVGAGEAGRVLRRGRRGAARVQAAA